MLAEKQINVFDATCDDGADKHLTVVANDIATSSWRIRKFPKNIRDLAEASARNSDMKLADFLAKAIVNYV